MAACTLLTTLQVPTPMHACPSLHTTQQPPQGVAFLRQRRGMEQVGGAASYPPGVSAISIGLRATRAPCCCSFRTASGLRSYTRSW
jgi:hypothetical protein